MIEIFLDRASVIRKNIKVLEEKLSVSIQIAGKKAIISGETFNEYEAEKVIEAIDFGFQVKTALTLKEEDMNFIKLPIKKITKKNNLERVRGRIIGKEGKTKRTIQNLANCEITLKNNEVGIIGNAEDIEETKTALIKLIYGSKEANVYKFLEERNRYKKLKE
jgi:ribosomal RNA assembly protein